MPLAPISLTLSLLVAFQSPGTKGGWRKVTSEEGGFSVTVPGQVDQRSATQPTNDGPAEVRQIVAEFEGVTYIATGTARPTAIAADQQSALFDTVRDLATGKGKTLQKEQRGTFQGMPICYLRIATTDAKGRPKVEQSRVIIGDPTHVYTLEVIIPKGVDINEDVKRFFDSFKRSEPGPRTAVKGTSKASSSAKGGGVGPAVAAKWRLFTPNGKGFSASMPGEPKHESPDPPTGLLSVDTYSVDLGDRLYSVVSYELPANANVADPGKALETMCKEVATGMKGTVADLKEVKDDGLDGREVLFEFAGPDKGKPAVGRARAFLAESRAYLLLYNGAKGTADREEVQKFLESFRLAKSAGTAKTKAKAKTKP